LPGSEGRLAPHAAWRAAIVPADEDAAAAGEGASDSCRRHLAWATLLQRVFEFDVLACPRCGGRLRVLATIEEPSVVHKILTHVGLSTEPVTPRAPPPLPASLWEPA
jgi:hypothetical protein